MEPNIKNDFNQLADYCVSMAEYFLKNQNGEFYPFGAYIDNTGQIIPSAISNSDEFPTSEVLITKLKTVFEKRLQGAEIQAYAIAYDSVVKNASYPNKIDAVATRMAHAHSDSVFLFYFPYKLNDGKVEFFESFGEIENS
jgi:hypothetical protein